MLRSMKASPLVPLVARAMLCISIIALSAPLLRADAAAVTAARKTLADAQTAEKKAQDAYDSAKGVIKAKIEATPEAQAANAAMTKAKAALDAANKTALDKTRAGADYKAAKASYDDADTKVKQLQADSTSANSTSRMDDLMKYTTTRNSARMEMTKLETDGLAADPGVQSAKAAVTAAQAQVDAINKKIDDEADADPNCQTLKKTLDDATAKTDDAKTALAAAIKQAQDEAKAKASGGNAGRSAGGHAAGGAGAGGAGGPHPPH